MALNGSFIVPDNDTIALPVTGRGRVLNEHSVLAEIGRIIGSSLDIDDVYDDFAATVRTLTRDASHTHA